MPAVRLDDDELARRLGVSPRQTIKQVCRGLERSGRLLRHVGSEGKIVNDLGPAVPAAVLQNACGNGKANHGQTIPHHVPA